MKGIAVEYRNGKTAVLLEDGRIIKRNGIIPAGKTVEISEPQALFTMRRATAACLCALVLLAAVFSWHTYTWTALAYSTITVHNGASIEYTLNRSGDVIAISGSDEASEETAGLIAETSIHKKGTEAVKEYISTISPEEKVDIKVSSKKPESEDSLIKELDDMIDQQTYPNVQTTRGEHEPHENTPGQDPGFREENIGKGMEQVPAIP